MEWANLALRWFHLVAGISWIGSSFYFMWLDSHMEAPSAAKPDVEGSLWMVHSGGFYQVEKRLIQPGGMPRTLHWFKWEAAFTWMSGMFLLGVVYYLSGGVLLLDPNRPEISLGAAVAMSLGTILVSWLVYDALWATAWAEANARVATALSFLGLFGVVYGLCQIYSGRGAFIHVGAVLGSAMVANVWHRILPCQQKMIDATAEGRTPDYELGKKAKRRSVHNSYVTLPVLFIMLSNHFAMTYSSKWNWLALILMIFIGAGIRHFMILGSKGKNGYPFLVPVAAAIAGVVFLCGNQAPDAAAAATAGTATEPVTMAEIQGIVQRRCIVCHSEKPTDAVWKSAPNGVKFDTPAQIKGMVGGIKLRVVDTKTMPLANQTGMTDAERARFAAWIQQGAPL
jgi:uncharacterized membrane protein